MSEANCNTCKYLLFKEIKRTHEGYYVCSHIGRLWTSNASGVIGLNTNTPDWCPINSFCKQDQPHEAHPTHPQDSDEADGNQAEAAEGG